MLIWAMYVNIMKMNKRKTTMKKILMKTIKMQANDTNKSIVMLSMWSLNYEKLHFPLADGWVIFYVKFMLQ